MSRGECYANDIDFGFEPGYSHYDGAARRAFRVCGMEERLMLFFMLPTIIFSGMWSVLLEAQDISLQPQRLTDRANERR